MTDSTEGKAAERLTSNGSFQNWGGGIDVLRSAGQSIWNSGAELADKSRQLVGTTFGVVTLDSKSAKVPDNKVVEVATPVYLSEGRVPAHRPTMAAYFDRSKSEIVICIDLPGLEKNDVELVVEDDVMSISGSIKDLKPTGPEGMDEIFNERTSGTFQRCFKLPSNANQTDIDALVENGHMEIRVKCTPISAEST